MKELKSIIESLRTLNVSEKTEKKNGLTYLSWAWAWDEVLKKSPTAKYEVIKNDQGLPYFYDQKTGYMVFTKIGGIGDGIANFTYNWLGHGYDLSDHAEYNISADIEIIEPQAVNSARIGLRWTNSTGVGLVGKHQFR